MTTDQEALDQRMDAAHGYLTEVTRTFERAVQQDLLTAETAINTCLAVASLLAKARFGESAGAAFLEARVADLAANMRRVQPSVN